jgi:hypothetical protein
MQGWADKAAQLALLEDYRLNYYSLSEFAESDLFWMDFANKELAQHLLFTRGQ